MTAIATPGRGTVLTFYSYKGGTGRTMALANVACLLAREHVVGRPALMMDWDFEAPGLHTFFEKRIPDAARTHYESAPGMIDLLDTAFRMLRELPEPSADAEDAAADAFAAGIDLAGAAIDAGVPNLHLIKAGRFDEHYAGTVNAFDWEALYERAPWLFPALARRLEREYAFTLVDSRTGLTDTSGICTMLMPEKLVVAFTPGRQSLTGLSGLTQRAIRYRRLSSDLRPLAVFPLPSRIESSEDDLRNKWRRASSGDLEVGAGYQPLFEKMFRESYGLEACSLESYFDAVAILHHAKSAYGERISVEDDPSTEVVSPSASYRRFTDRLLELANPWEDLNRVREVRRIGDLVSHALRAIESDAPSAETSSAAIAVLSQAADALAGMATTASTAQTSASPPLWLDDPGVADAFRFVAAQSGTPLGLRIQALTRAVDLETMTVGAEHPKLIAPLRHLAEKQREARDLAAARSSAERALAIAETNFAKNDSRLADLLSYAGELRLALGDTAGSDVAIERARNIRGERSTATPVPRAYLDWLRSECASVELLGLRVKQGHAIRLNSVYVPLTTTAPTEDSKAGKARLTPEAREIGTVGLLVLAVIVANPELKAPMVNQVFAGGGGPNVNGAIFPFCFICIMCGAISGFHALVASGTTPKMISKESDIRVIGYGAMLIEGLVGIMALIAAASLPQGDYWAINIDLSKAAAYADKLEQLDATTDNLAQIEQQVGGESLRGRTGGAVTLAVGMAQIFRDAMQRVAGNAINLESVIKYWYHFAIMFEALFILTTIDTGTRIARFLLQEVLGKVYPAFDRTDWIPGAVLSTGIVTAAWGVLIWTGSIDTIWPMFGIANQMLAVIALAVVTTVMINAGRGRYAPLTILPMLFVISSTLTAGYQMITGPFSTMLADGWKLGGLNARLVQGVLNISFTLFMIGSVVIILSQAITRWLSYRAPRAVEISKAS